VVLSPDNRYLFVPDLGLDKIMVYQGTHRSGRSRFGLQKTIMQLRMGQPRLS